MAEESNFELLSSRLTNLQNEILIIQNNQSLILKENKELKNDINLLYDDIDFMTDKLFDLETDINRLNQYSRRENIELHNIPESIIQRNLEKFIIDLLNSLKIDMTSYDIVATHRIGKKANGKPRIVLVRFINRKHAYRAMKSSKHIKKSINPIYKKIFICENLCPSNKMIFNKLYKAKKLGKIHSVWSSNGAVLCKYTEDDDSVLIQHIDEIDDVFKDSWFE